MLSVLRYIRSSIHTDHSGVSLCFSPLTFFASFSTSGVESDDSAAGVIHCGVGGVALSSDTAPASQSRSIGNPGYD